MVLSRRRQMPKSPKRPEVRRCHSSSSLLRATYSGGVARNSVITLGRCHDRVGSASGFEAASAWPAQKIREGMNNLGRAVASEWTQQGGRTRKQGNGTRCLISAELSGICTSSSLKTSALSTRRPAKMTSSGAALTSR